MAQSTTSRISALSDNRHIRNAKWSSGSPGSGDTDAGRFELICTRTSLQVASDAEV